MPLGISFHGLPHQPATIVVIIAAHSQHAVFLGAISCSRIYHALNIKRKIIQKIIDTKEKLSRYDVLDFQA